MWPFLFLNTSSNVDLDVKNKTKNFLEKTVDRPQIQFLSIDYELRFLLKLREKLCFLAKKRPKIAQNDWNRLFNV
jgi:hypothetical protein